uniref:Uncharacterized protein n=1 Tax=Arundo donax TaxID=35708 RepID=A0A0A9HD65_ARUDO
MSVYSVYQRTNVISLENQSFCVYIPTFSMRLYVLMLSSPLLAYKCHVAGLLNSSSQ